MSICLVTYGLTSSPITLNGHLMPLPFAREKVRNLAKNRRERTLEYCNKGNLRKNGKYWFLVDNKQKNQDVLMIYVLKYEFSTHVKWFLNVHFLAPMSRFFAIFSEIAHKLHCSQNTDSTHGPQSSTAIFIDRIALVKGDDPLI